MNKTHNAWMKSLSDRAARAVAGKRIEKRRRSVGAVHTECLENRVMMSLTVTSNFDGAAQSQQTTLIGAILMADGTGGDTIILPADSTFTLSQTGYSAPASGNGSVNTGVTLLPGINQPITIEGNGSTIELAPGAMGRFFSVNSNLILDNINLIGGVAQGGNGGAGGGGGGGGGAGLGGAVFVNGSIASLTMNQASIAYSSASGGGGGSFLPYTSGPNSGGIQGIGGAGGGGLGGNGANGGSSGNTNVGGGGGGPRTSATGQSGADSAGGNGGTGGNPGTAGVGATFGGGGGGGGSANATIGASSGGNGGTGGFGGGGGASGFRTVGGAGGFGGGGGATLPGSGQGSAGSGGTFAGAGQPGAGEGFGGGGAGLGGAIFNYQGTVNLNNVSLVGNSATGGSGYGGGSGVGGAIFDDSGSVTLQNATLANNLATAAGGSFSGPNGAALGAGIYDYKATGLAAPTVSLFNSALASNQVITQGSGGANAPVEGDILSGAGGTVTANGTNHNFIGASSGTISGASVLTGAADLDFAGNFGGFLMAPPEPGSPLAGAGDPTTSLTVDETGATRSGTTPTIGAYEGALPSPFPLAAGSIVVSESSLGGLFAIDPTTGNRQTISAANVIGTGPALINPNAVTIDSTGNIYVVAGSVAGNFDEIYKVDPTDGNRTLLSGNGTATGTAFQNITDIAYDSATSSLLVADNGGPAIYSVSTSTGNRTLLSNGTTPNSANGFQDPISITYNSTAGIVEGDQGFDTASFDSALLKIAGNGARAVFSDDTTPTTANQIGQVEGITSASNGSILALDSFSDPTGSPNLTVLDSVASTGARTLLATFSAIDSSSNLLSEYGVATNSSGTYVTQTGTLASDNQVLKVTGSTVTELAGNDLAFGPYFSTGLNIGIAVVPSLAPAAPTVSTNPSSATMNSGGNTSFTSAATGSPAPAEQWQISTDGGTSFTNITDGGVYSGATSATLTITGGTTSLSGNEYQVVFTNNSGSATSTAATLTVDFAPTVTNNPTSDTISNGGNASFTVAATGNPTPTVQWQVSTDGGTTFNNLANTGIYSGGATNTLTLTGATSTENGYEYQAVFSTTLFGAGSPSTATTTSATLTVNQAPAITSVDHAAAIIGTAFSYTFTTTGSPTPTLSESGALPLGLTFTNNGNGTATIAGTAAALSNGTYPLILTAHNGIGSDATQSFTLVIESATVITSGNNASALTGSALLFTVTTGGSGTHTLAETGALPTGVTFTDNGDGTATLAGTAASGTGNNYPLSITATGLADSATQSFTLNVTEQYVVTNLNASGSGSLAAALASAVTGGFASDITFQSNLAGTIIESSPDANAAATGAGPSAFVIKNNANITIDGADGGSGITLSGGGTMRQFFIASGASLTLDDLTLAGGKAQGGTGGSGDGTGGGGAGLGGAVFVDGGSLTIQRSTLNANQAVGGAGNSTGTAFNGGGGGGMSGNGNPSSGNSIAGAGGGLNGGAAPSVNGGFGGGGGGGNASSTTGGAGGFGGGGGGGAGFFHNGTGGTGGFGGGGGGGGVSIGTAGSGGFGGGAGGVDGGAGGGGAGMGGAIFNDAGTITLENSTLTNNTAQGGSGAQSGAGLGGAIFNFNGTLDTTNVTISANTTTNVGRGIYNLGDAATATAVINNTIIGQSNFTFDDFYALTISGGMSTTSGLGNLIDTSSGFSGTIASTADPLLGTLTNNGGDTQTLLPAANSPVVDAGSITAIAGATNDQRGFARTVGGTVGIGSVEVIDAPAVAINPTSTTFNTGGNASFTSSATGNPAATEQWQISTDGGTTFTNITDGGLYSGAASATLTITGGTTALNGDQYQVVFTNTSGSATSTAATLTVDFAPAISSNPTSDTINAGENTSFTAAATGLPIPTVQWQVSTNGGSTFSNITNGGVYSGATTNTLTITGATALMNTDQYQAVYSNTLSGAGSASTAMTTAATLTVDAAPSISTNPSNATVNAAGNISLSAAATGNPAPTVQWEVSTDGGTTFGSIANGGVYSGATSNTLTITGALTSMNSNEYKAVYTNTLLGAGSASSASTTPATLTVDFSPAVTANPSNSAIGSGGNTSFTVSAAGDPAPTVQWQVSTDGGTTFNNLTSGGIYSGVSTDTLALTGATLTENGYEYRAVFSNTLLGAGSPTTATTTAATLTVSGAPVVGVNPTSVTINAAGNTSFASSATGSPTPTEQWQVSTNGGATFTNLTDGGVYSGATTATLSITGSTAAMNGYKYRDVFTNGSGTADTNPSTLNVDFAPTVTTNPTSSAVSTGNNTSFTVAATGNPTPTAQWQFSINGGTTFSNLTNGGIYSGVTTDTLNLAGTTLTENGFLYRAIFSNTLFGAGSPSTATTTAATLTVSAAPVVGVSPTNATVNAGGNTSFTSSATGNPTPTERWQVSTDGGTTFTNITNGSVYSGATSNTLSITSGTANMNGDEYRDVFTNSNGTASTNPSTLTVDSVPTVTGNPNDATTGNGGNTSFTVAAIGNPAPSVRWQVSTDGGTTFSNLTNTGIYSGVTTDTLNLTGTIVTDNGYQYRAVFSNTLFGAGSPITTATTPATLTISDAPVVGVNPTSATINAGDNTSFTSSATGTPTPTAQWQVSTDGGATFNNISDGGAYSGVTTTTLSITGSTAAMNGYEYRNVFTNGDGTANTNPSALTVDFAPTVTANPISISVTSGGNASFTIATAGNPTPTVQWQVSTDGGTTFNNLTNGGIYGGVTTDTLSLTGTTLTENSYQYRAVISSTLRGATSPSTATTMAATLTVGTPVITVAAYAQLVSSTSNTGTLHVQAIQDDTDTNLTYTWSIISQPSAVSHKLAASPVSREPDATLDSPSAAPLALFAINGTNSAKNTSVTFLASGTYTLQVVASNGTQSATSQVQVTTTVKSSVTPTTTQPTQVSGVQPVGDANSVTGFVVSFNGALDPTTAQNVRGYRILQQPTTGNKLHFAQWLFGINPGNQTETSAYQIASAVYNSQTDSVLLTLAAPMPVKNGVRLVQVLGTGPHAVLDANGKPIDGDSNGKVGGTFTYHLNMSVTKSITYKTADGDTVKLSLSGPGEIVTLLPTGTKTPIIDLINTDSVGSILTGKLRKGRKGLPYTVLDELNGTANVNIQLAEEFHVNQNNGPAAV